jgi:small subunit ribosomal protein S6
LKDYETTVVLDAGLDEEALNKEIQRVEEVITSGGGEINKVERWGIKRFAHLLKKHRQGYYFHMRFSGPPTLPKQLESLYKLNEQVLRYLTVQSHPAAEAAVTTPETAPRRETRERQRTPRRGKEGAAHTPHGEVKDES